MSAPEGYHGAPIDAVPIGSDPCHRAAHGMAVARRGADGLVTLEWSWRAPVLVSPELLEQMVAEINEYRLLRRLESDGTP